MMSGWRWVGSSVGSGRCSITDDEPVTSSTISASSLIVNSLGLPMLTGWFSPESRRAITPRISSSTKQKLRV